MPTGSYDVIVVGNDPAGLIAGALCATRGMRVLIARTGRARASYQLGPHTLPTSALPFIGLSNPTIARVVDELHLEHTLRRKLIAREPAFQLVAPGARIDVGADDEALSQELGRELDDPKSAATAFALAGDISEQLDAVLGQDDTFPPTGFWKKREVGRSQARIVDDAAAWKADADADPLTAAIVSLPAALSCPLDPRLLRPEACARALTMWRSGTARIPGDWQSLEDMLQDTLTKHAGEVRDVTVAEITFSWGKATGVTLESGEQLGAEHIVAALPLDELMALTAAKHPKRLAQCAEKIEPAGYRYTLNLLVAEAGVPAGMAQTVLLIGDPEGPLVGDNALAIFVGEPDDKARVVVTVEAMLPASDSDDDDDRASTDQPKLRARFADLRVQIRKRLEDVMPFVGDHILLAHSPHEAVPAEGGDGVLELPEPLPPSPLWRSTLEPHMGVSGAPYDVGIKRLTLASSQVLLGLGLEGIFETGWSAARIASAGKKRDVAKEELLAAKR